MGVNKRNPISLEFYPWGFRVPVILMIVYFWWIICTPHTRFPILGDINFEKILAAFWLLSLMLQSEKPRLASPFTTLFALQILLFYILSWISWIPESTSSIMWQSNYWKQVLFFIMAVLTVRDHKDFFLAILGMVIIVYGYQLLSWRDFLFSGGSYVHQQGIKRMTGMWALPGYGAGNFWGSLSAFVFPFALYTYRRLGKVWMKRSILPLMLLLIMSVIFSGSRGSLITLLAYLAFAYRAHIWRPKFMIGALILVIISVTFMPEEYKHRYSMIIVSEEEIESATGTDKSAKLSAASRVQGLVDGWNIMLEHPQGVGPGSSPTVRDEVNKQMATSEGQFQLHNLYGQVLAEAGVLGSLLIFLLWYRMFRFLTLREPHCSFAHEKDAIVGGLVVMLVYGMASHSLYSYWWIWLYAFTVSVFNIGRAGR